MATLRLAIDPRGMEAGGRRGESALDRLLGRTQQVETGLGGMARAATRSLAAVAAGFASIAGVSAAIRGISQFETGMSQLGAVSRATASELKDMRTVAMDLGSSTEYSATQAASGLNFLAMAGFNAAESMAAIPDVLNLATAAQLDLGQAADISSNIMSAFAISAENAGAVADVLAAASSRANTDVGQLGEAMKFVGPVASALGIEMNDAAAAIGVLSDAGIQGGMAGTGLRRVLSSLANTTPQAAAVIRDLGLELDALNPATTSIVEIVEQLSDAGIDAAQALTIFGDRGGPAILALTSQVGGLRELTGELSNVEGEATRMADTMRDNLGGDINSLKSALEGLILAMGEAGLTAVLRAAIQGLTDVTRIISQTVQAIGSLIDYVGRLSLFARATDQIRTSSEAAAGAISKEVEQSAALMAVLSDGRTMSIDVAGVKLTQARAHLEAADAIRQENIAAIEASDAYRKQVETQAFLNEEIQKYYEMRDKYGADKEGAGDADRFRRLVEGLQRAVDIQKQLIGDAADLSPEYAAARSRVEQLEALIAEASGATIRLGNGMGDAADNASTLRTVIASIDISGLSGQAASLAGMLGVAAGNAAALNAALNRTAGLKDPTAATAGGLSFGMPSVGDPSVGSAVLGFGSFGKTRKYIENNLPDIPSFSGGGGGGGGGSAASSANQLQTAYDSLIASLDPLVRATQDYEKAQETINDALEAGYIGAGEAGRAYDLARERFEEASAAAQNTSDIWDEFASIGGSAIDRLIAGTGDWRDILQDVIKELILAYAKAKLLESVTGGSSSDSLGTLIFKSFAGMFDGGGTIPNGQYGLVGENGPELVQSTPNGSVVTSRQDTARRARAAQSGAVINIDARGAQEGVADQIAAAIRSAAPQIVGQSVKTVQKNLANYQTEYSRFGGIA
ncbi:phage tail tape measure protein [Oceaniglobus ichthyenteri]|uniref:phage tail tape measure protein n=1 Tax=Oceaniglobus ichthyenteri TaxID=2136177 RepID=UPI000D3968BE|nr:phage tail tape measure protein [Oceaniglobus ichthyenteri]